MRGLLLAFVLSIVGARAAAAQEALSNRPPTVFGPVKTVRLETSGLKKLKGRWVEVEPRWQTETEYSQDKRRVEEGIGHTPGASASRRGVYTFDHEGRLTNWDLYEADGSPTGTKSVYKYDERGRVSEIVHYLLGSFSHRDKFSYPSERRVEITSRFNYNEPPVKEVDIYDGKGNVVQALLYEEGGRLRGKEFYKYDEKGNPVEFALYGARGTLEYKQTHRYEFDARGNWVRRVTSEYDPEEGRLRLEPARLAVRTISYY